MPLFFFSNHSSISAAVQLNFPVPDFMPLHKVYLKSHINIDVKKYIYLSGEISIGHVALCHLLPPNSRDKSWFTAKCREALRYTQAAYKLWSSARSDFSWDNYSLAHETAEQVYRAAEMN